MALPNTNISTSLVGTTLGTSSRDVGTLCTHPNINKWSKWKPVRFNTQGVGLTQANLEAVNYGIGFNEYANINAVRTAYLNGEDSFVYNKPRGGINAEPYRIGDFRTYDHDALQPVISTTVSSQAQNIEGGYTTIVGTLALNGSPSSTEIGWADLNLDARKLAMAIYDSSGVLKKTGVATNAGETSIEMDTRSPLPVLAIGEYKIFMFMTNNAGTTDSNLIALPNHPNEGFTFNVVGLQVFITIRATWSSARPNDIDIILEGINNSGSSVNLLNCTMRVRNQANDCTSTIQQGELVVLVPSTIVIPPTETLTTLYSTTVSVEKSDFLSWKVCWSNTGAYPNTFEANIIDGA